MAAVAKWQYEPAMRAGHPVDVHQQVTLWYTVSLPERGLSADPMGSPSAVARQTINHVPDVPGVTRLPVSR